MLKISWKPLSCSLTESDALYKADCFNFSLNSVSKLKSFAASKKNFWQSCKILSCPLIWDVWSKVLRYSNILIHCWPVGNSHASYNIRWTMSKNLRSSSLGTLTSLVSSYFLTIPTSEIFSGIVSGACSSTFFLFLFSYRSLICSRSFKYAF